MNQEIIDNYWDKQFSITPEQIIQKFTKNKWLIERVFWNNSTFLFHDEYEQLKNQLKNKWYIDVDDYFPPIYNEEKIYNTLNILFKVPTFEKEEEPKKFLWIF